MSSEITINRAGAKTSVRPSWLHSRPTDTQWPGDMKAQLEMLESIRNVLEDIRGSQMLKCDVRHAIMDIREGLVQRTRADDARWLEKEAKRFHTSNPEHASALRTAAIKLRRRRK